MGAVPRTEKRLSTNTTVKVKAEGVDTRKKGLQSASLKHGRQGATPK
jgi:hypothetical protein